MIVTKRLARIESSMGTLVGVRGGGSSAEARAWLAERLRWEERLQELEQDRGYAPRSTRLPEGGQKAC